MRVWLQTWGGPVGRRTPPEGLLGPAIPPIVINDPQGTVFSLSSIHAKPQLL